MIFSFLAYDLRAITYADIMSEFGIWTSWSIAIYFEENGDFHVNLDECLPPQTSLKLKKIHV